MDYSNQDDLARRSAARPYAAAAAAAASPSSTCPQTRATPRWGLRDAPLLTAVPCLNAPSDVYIHALAVLRLMRSPWHGVRSDGIDQVLDNLLMAVAVWLESEPRITS